MMYADKSKNLYEPKMECSLKLLDQIVTSKDAKYMSQTLFSIASIQMMLENYDESEKTLKELSTSSYIDDSALNVLTGLKDYEEGICLGIILSKL
ncbi:hypothetical protein KPL44_22450 [Clostridium sp. DSM 17811]|nr:hypothetical protein [Clostridium sp. DSM 17811]MBU3102006.1 hypothetical protein [Clostridium sp. DSM 17811]